MSVNRPAQPVRVAASMMCANLARLGDEIEALEYAGVDLFHFDAADGSFVPNLLFGPDVVAALRARTRLPFEVHLMTRHPMRFADAFLDAGADLIIAHVEAGDPPAQVIERIRARGGRAGLALNPRTPAARALPFLPELDQLTFMTVQPGFAGQPFRSEVVAKLAAAARDYRRFPHLRTEVDGSINAQTIPRVVAAGADTLVGGSSGLFHEDGLYVDHVRELRAAAAFEFERLEVGSAG